MADTTTLKEKAVKYLGALLISLAATAGLLVFGAANQVLASPWVLLTLVAIPLALYVTGFFLMFSRVNEVWFDTVIILTVVYPIIVFYGFYLRVNA